MPTDEHISKEEAEWLAKKKIKENIHRLDDMTSIGLNERKKLFKELEERQEYMTETEKKKYDSLLKDRNTMTRLQLLLDESEED